MVPVIGWLRSAARRLSPRARAFVLVVLLLGAAVLALAPTHKAGLAYSNRRLEEEPAA